MVSRPPSLLSYKDLFSVLVFHLMLVDISWIKEEPADVWAYLDVLDIFFVYLGYSYLL